MLKITHCSMSMSAEHRSKFFSPSPAIVTSPYERKFLEWDEKPLTLKPTNIYEKKYNWLVSFRLQEFIIVAGFRQLVECFSITSYCFWVGSKFSLAPALKECGTTRHPLNSAPVELGTRWSNSASTKFGTFWTRHC